MTVIGIEYVDANLILHDAEQLGLKLANALDT